MGAGARKKSKQNQTKTRVANLLPPPSVHFCPFYRAVASRPVGLLATNWVILIQRKMLEPHTSSALGQRPSALFLTEGKNSRQLCQGHLCSRCCRAGRREVSRFNLTASVETFPPDKWGGRGKACLAPVSFLASSFSFTIRNVCWINF